ncbi:NifU family protein [Bacteriovorax sp. Seq25_V]|uniref:NifU family protein n=1 Tax=Bacteriovorax sp. Seq25_V TaxID=1201288 RepID=UPI00038A18EB|nr:NifU family protein [Bacteriovorax sp. Seq25_V]EQC44808.1 NifU-like protein [Bacteriovorax sp. Seq25_V]
MLRKIEALFDEQVRPALAAHGGNVEIVDFDNGKLFVKLQGGCQGCSSSSATLTEGIQRLVKQNFPEIEEIVDLTDHQSGENPYM